MSVFKSLEESEKEAFRYKKRAARLRKAIVEYKLEIKRLRRLIEKWAVTKPIDISNDL